jgi:hypothetical protein
MANNAGTRRKEGRELQQLLQQVNDLITEYWKRDKNGMSPSERKVRAGKIVDKMDQAGSIMSDQPEPKGMDKLLAMAKDFLPEAINWLPEVATTVAPLLLSLL